MEKGLRITENQRKRTVGIDLGTTYCCLAMMQHGKVEIIANDQDKRTTPSYVAFTNLEILSGALAKKQISWNLDNINNTIYDAKRLIGQDFDNPKVQSDREHWTFNLIKDKETGKPKYLVNFMKEEATFSPEQISQYLLKKMKETAEEFTDGAIVEDAVITVPAYFNDAQRQATKMSAESAGFHVLRLLNEPTAAAIAYGLENKCDVKQNVLVYDLGGGTFDVSIVTIDEGIFEVKSTAGDTHLGGRDFDNCMVQHLLLEFIEEHGTDFTEDREAYKRANRRLLDACEPAKHTLSTRKQASIHIKGFYMGTDFRTTITRATFEDLCNDLFEATLKEVKKALNDANMDTSDIDEVVLVGGSTRIPKVQQILQGFFDGKNLYNKLNPDEAVAYGAAVQAAKLSGDRAVKNFSLQDVNPLSLGIELIGDRMSVVIKRNSKIPIESTEDFYNVYENQEAVSIRVYEGESDIASENHILGVFKLNINPAPPGESVIPVTFKITLNGILEVTARNDASGNMNNIVISNDKDRLPVSDIAKMKQKSVKF